MEEPKNIKLSLVACVFPATTRLRFTPDARLLRRLIELSRLLQEEEDWEWAGERVTSAVFR